jgi:predicted dehydrogenase
MKSLIVGLGFGQAVYKNVLIDLGADVVTVDLDPTKGADYTDINQAIREHKHFDTVNICTPNFTHLKVARQIAAFSDIVFIEKPGVKCAEYWEQLVKDYPKTRFMMVKNNQWRTNIDEFKLLARDARDVYIFWINNNRVPNPGTWFTTKELAFGGVSRDLMPHLMSWFQALEPDYANAHENQRVALQVWQLGDVADTDYGAVNTAGTYDVDDFFKVEYLTKGRRWFLESNWRSMEGDDISIRFVYPDGSHNEIPLGLCPEDAYKNMISDAVSNLNNNEFWAKQFEQDMWIHKQIETV